MEFDEDIMACADLVQKSDPERFQATMAAPVSARPTLFAFYAMNCEIARAPWASQESMIAEMRLQWWRDIGEELASGKPVRRHFVSTPLERLLPRDLAKFIDPMCEARRWDIYRDPFTDEAAFVSYIDATAGNLTWMAARSLGDCSETVVRDFAYAAGIANWLRAIPALEAQKRVPLLDGTPEGVRRLAKGAMERLTNARAQRHKVSKAAGVALLYGWQAGAILKQAVAEPGRVASGSLGQSEFSKRSGLMLRAATGRW